MVKRHYYLFRYGAAGEHGYRMESGSTPQEACKLAFGVVYAAPYAGNVVYKDLGTKSPRYATQKIKQTWYGSDGWSVIGG